MIGQTLGRYQILAKLARAAWATKKVYRPAEYYRQNVMICAAKAHSELMGADVVVTYAINTFVFAEQSTNSLIYYPKFVRLTQCGGAGSSPVQQ